MLDIIRNMQITGRAYVCEVKMSHHFIHIWMYLQIWASR